MNEDTAFQLAIMTFVVFVSFEYLFPGAAWFPMLIMIAAFVGAFYLIRGVIEFFFRHEHGEMNFWAGVFFFLIIIVFFSAMPQAMFATKTILALIGSSLIIAAKSGLALLAV
jgi:hypothetical protein